MHGLKILRVGIAVIAREDYTGNLRRTIRYKLSVHTKDIKKKLS